MAGHGSIHDVPRLTDLADSLIFDVLNEASWNCIESWVVVGAERLGADSVDHLIVGHTLGADGLSKGNSIGASLKILVIWHASSFGDS